METQIELVRYRATRKVDDYAGAARSSYLTVIAGQDDLYREKRTQAEDYLASLAAGDVAAVPGAYIQVEMVVYSLTAQAAAERIVAAAAVAAAKGAAIERIRLTAKEAIKAAIDEQAIEQAVNDAIEAFSML